MLLVFKLPIVSSQVNVKWLGPVGCKAIKSI